MRKAIPVILLCALAFGGGLAAAWFKLRPQQEVVPDPPALITQMREVARLETLDVTLYKKVTFAPEPQPAGSFWGEVYSWAKFTLNPPKGKAIIFAVVHIGLDVSKLDASAMRAKGKRIDVVLPALQSQVELKPGDTEVIGSNLNTAQTAQLFELAKDAFKKETDADAQLRAKARASAQRALEGLLLNAGFREVHFVDALPPEVGS